MHESNAACAASGGPVWPVEGEHAQVYIAPHKHLIRHHNIADSSGGVNTVLIMLYHTLFE